MKTNPAVYKCEKCGHELEYPQTAMALEILCHGRCRTRTLHWQLKYYALGKREGLSAVRNFIRVQEKKYALESTSPPGSA